MKKTLYLCLFYLLVPLAAHALELGMPIGCDIGKDCFIQYYVDTDGGEGAADFKCNALSYNNHDGTDFRLRNYLALKKNIPVYAAADGFVQTIDTPVPDAKLKELEATRATHHQCVNGITLYHGGGWETAYCHLREDSIKLQKGDKVKQGDLLGYVGMTEVAAIPHLHFAVRENGKALDPFTGKSADTGCTEPYTTPLWNKETLEKLPYTPTTVLTAGFAAKTPIAEDARGGKDILTRLDKKTKSVILWADLMGVFKGDSVMLEITDPAGKIIHTHQLNMEESLPVYFVHSGPGTIKQWTKGTYHGKITVFRHVGDADRVVLTAEETLDAR
jgi:hypothetical protein